LEESDQNSQAKQSVCSASGLDGSWLRYHHIFQEFLQQRIRWEEPELVQTILLRLGDVYEEHHEWEKAYFIYRQLNDLDLLCGLIERAGMPLLLGGRLITLQAWLNNLSAEHFQKLPALLSLKGALLCYIGEGHKALSTLDRTILEFQKTDDRANLTLAFVRRSAAHRLVGDYARSLKDADEALRLSENELDMQFTYAEAERFKGISLHHLGKIAEATLVQEDALEYYEQMGDKQRAAWVLVELGNSYLASGNYPAALNTYNGLSMRCGRKAISPHKQMYSIAWEYCIITRVNTNRQHRHLRPGWNAHDPVVPNGKNHCS